jgi:hypothetical protein
MFKSAAAVLQKLALDPRLVGGQIGMIGVLQTWTAEIRYHPHIHFLLPGGGITPKGHWRFTEEDFFLPAPAFSPIFRAKFRDALKKTPFFSSVPSKVWRKKWVVDCQPAGTGETVLKYFTPYIFRVALSNRRLVKLEKGHVTFKCKDRKTKQPRLLTLPALQFLSRFLQHVLPDGFVKVRYYSFLHPKNRKLFETVLWALSGDSSPKLAHPSESSQGEETSSPSLTHGCPLGGRAMTLIETLLPKSEAPRELSHMQNPWADPKVGKKGHFLTGEIPVYHMVRGLCLPSKGQESPPPSQ